MIWYGQIWSMFFLHVVPVFFLFTSPACAHPAKDGAEDAEARGETGDSGAWAADASHHSHGEGGDGGSAQGWGDAEHIWIPCSFCKSISISAFYRFYSNLSNDLFDLLNLFVCFCRSVYHKNYLFVCLFISLIQLYRHQVRCTGTDHVLATGHNGSRAPGAPNSAGGWDGARGGCDGGAECGETRGENRSRVPWEILRENGEKGETILVIILVVDPDNMCLDFGKKFLYRSLNNIKYR